MLTKYRKYPVIQSDIVDFNVGGQLFSTLKSTVTKKIKKPIQNNPEEDEFYETNMLEAVLEGYVEAVYDKEKRVFIDRSPKLFGYILDYLRMANTDDKFTLPAHINKEELKNEAEFYNVQGLYDLVVPPKPVFSRILSADQSNKLIELGGFSRGDEWTTIYNGKQDGFSANSFHAKCDGIANTLVIIKSSTGNIFGGFTKAKWDQLNQYKTDKDAFIFSLVNRENKPVRFNIAPGRESYAIFCTAHYGPTFGGGHDLFLSTNCNSDDSTSNSNLGNCFRNPDFQLNEDSKSFLGGSHPFRVEEIEVLTRKAAN
jgi:hypothetical protein